MNHVIVTGAAGFIGQVLVQHLLQHGLGGRPVDAITAVDLHFAAPATDPRVEQVAGAIDAAATRDRALARPARAVFHLASLPSGAGESDYAAGRRVNLDATLALLEALGQAGWPQPARFVYASSIAVYGESLPAQVDESTPTAPALTYGTHKLACELLVADATRRGWVEGCSLRLPGVVARPESRAGLLSAFMSDIFWRIARGEPCTVPVREDGRAWWISARTCAANLAHAATLEPAALRPTRSYPMPALWLSVGEVVGALAGRFGAQAAAGIRYEPQPLVQRLFAEYPPLATPLAQALGLRHDGDVDGLIKNVLGP
ncbi:NAD-dependent epimerase/dehydratase family protein [Ramlibacter sp. MAHUQ-53]|uniref:NAD-dependent epimerase/dehydratase family protein n=1 Tax=unclassified Ramlibacter TaxID=2617605 RepID=UPI00363C0418